MRTRTIAVIAILSVALAGCSHGEKKNTLELSKMEGKKVALIEVDGEPTSRSIVEVALVNQLLKRGSFILVSKQDIEAARQAFQQDPSDWQGIARRAGADFALKAKVLQFDGDTREGYSTEVIEDSQLAAERGEKEGKTERIYKVKALIGKVRVQMDFANLADPPASRSGIAEAEDQISSEARNEAAHLPPKLRFLEQLSNEAFRKFFDQYN